MNKEDIKLILNKDNPLVLEIGCNDGTDSFEFLDTFSKISLYCFEPDNRAINKFKKKIQDKRCKLFEFALGNINGEIDFYQSSGHPNGVSGDWDKSGSIKKPKNHLKEDPWCKFDNISKVKCKKLDSWIDENNISFIDFIWADVQGAEEDLIMGGIKTLREKTNYFFTEYNDRELYENQIGLDPLISLLEVFEIVKIFPHDILLKNKNIR